MVDETPDDADNEITRIVRRPGPQSLPINIVKPQAPAAPSSPAQPVSPAVPPVIQPMAGPGFSPVPPISVSSPAAPPMIAPGPSPLVAHRPAANDIAPPVTPPVASERSRPMMMPPGRPAAPPASTPPIAPVASTPSPPVPPAASVDPAPVPTPAPTQTPTQTPVAPAAMAQPVLAQAAPIKAAPATPAPPATAAPTTTAIDPVVGWLVVIKGPGRGAARNIVTGRNSLGSASGQDLRIDFGDPAIAPQGHLYIVYDEEGREFVVEDGKQKVVVRLNGKLLTETMPIGSGDDLRIGATTLRFIALCGPGFDWQEPEASGTSSAETSEEVEGSGASAAAPVAGAMAGGTE